MFLLFLRFIRILVTSQMANAPLRTASWTFCFEVFITILKIHSFLPSIFIDFFTSKSKQFCGFLYAFIFVLNFSKALEFCQTLTSTSRRSLLIFYSISSSLSSFCMKLFRPESESSSSDSTLVS